MTAAGAAGGLPGAGDARRYTGTVAEFDEAVGLGFVDAAGEGTAAARRLRFHCTQIADGSRSIDVGTEVSFVVIAGRGGTWEAGDLRNAP